MAKPYPSKQRQADRLSERLGVDPSEIKVRRVIAANVVIANVGGEGYARWHIGGMYAEPICDCVRVGQSCEACAPTGADNG